MPRKKKFTPIKIETDNPSDIFESHRVAISKAIIEAISYGISYKKRKVDFAYVVIKNMLVITLSIDKREFIDLIDDNHILTDKSSPCPPLCSGGESSLLMVK